MLHGLVIILMALVLLLGLLFLQQATRYEQLNEYLRDPQNLGYVATEMLGNLERNVNREKTEKLKHQLAEVLHDVEQLMHKNDDARQSNLIGNPK